jgi:hypothetical protein
MLIMIIIGMNKYDDDAINFNKLQREVLRNKFSSQIMQTSQ